MIEVLAAAALIAGQQAAPQSARIGPWTLTDYGTDCVLMREFRMQGRPYWLWIDSDGRGASLRVLSPEWRGVAGREAAYRLSLNGQPVADRMQGVAGPEGTGGYAVATDAATMLGMLPAVNTVRIDDEAGGLVWGGSTTGLAEAATGLRDCVEGLEPAPAG